MELSAQCLALFILLILLDSHRTSWRPYRYVDFQNAVYCFGGSLLSTIAVLVSPLCIIYAEGTWQKTTRVGGRWTGELGHSTHLIYDTGARP